MKRDKRGQFIKGSNGNTFEGFGIYYDCKGYPKIFINGKNIMIHVFVWERVNGSKPKGYDIHHKDFNKKNYSLDNLEQLTQSDHLRIHAGWMHQDGEWLTKPCKMCGNDLALNEFYQRKTLKHKTPSNYCRECTKSNSRNKNAKH